MVGVIESPTRVGSAPILRTVVLDPQDTLVEIDLDGAGRLPHGERLDRRLGIPAARGGELGTLAIAIEPPTMAETDELISVDDTSATQMRPLVGTSGVAGREATTSRPPYDDIS